jgi:Metal binding domain of Ada
MRVYTIISFSVVILLITTLFAGAVTVPATAQPAAGQTTHVQSYAGSFVGSKKSYIYHYPSCYEAKKIKAENLVTFASVADACTRSYRPCKV